MEKNKISEIFVFRQLSWRDNKPLESTTSKQYTILRGQTRKNSRLPDRLTTVNKSSMKFLEGI